MRKREGKPEEKKKKSDVGLHRHPRENSKASSLPKVLGVLERAEGEGIKTGRKLTGKRSAVYIPPDHITSNFSSPIKCIMVVSAQTKKRKEKRIDRFGNERELNLGERDHQGKLMSK